MKKLTFDLIKDSVQKRNYILLSEHYNDAFQKLDLQCPYGHVFSMEWNHFQQGCNCPICAKVNRKNKRKHSFTYIKGKIEAKGYKLLSTEYENNKTKLKVQCLCDHIFYIRYNSFIIGIGCPYCYGNVRLSFEFVKEQIEKIGYTLLSEKYENNLSLLKLQCPRDHIFHMSYSNFKEGHRCPKCSFVNGKSKLEVDLLECIKTFYNDDIVENDRTRIINPITGKSMELDLFFPDLNKAIEFNGMFWHGLEKVRKNDQIKINECREKNIDLLVINENEWVKNKDNCLNKIGGYLN